MGFSLPHSPNLFQDTTKLAWLVSFLAVVVMKVGVENLAWFPSQSGKARDLYVCVCVYFYSGVEWRDEG